MTTMTFRIFFEGIHTLPLVIEHSYLSGCALEGEA